MKWENPPEIDRRSSKSGVWAKEARTLRDSPGRWAMITQGMTPGKAGQLANNIRSGVLKNFSPRGDFEATSRLGAVYARYMGGEKT
jgi:hypothetical protein